MQALLKSLVAITFGVSLSISTAHADDDYNYSRGYEVTITNITKGQTFTPQLVVSHRANVALFELGAPASEELAILAEAGNTEPLTNVLASLGRRVSDVQTIAGLLAPGQSASTILQTTRRTNRLSVGAMLIPTNDTFVALDSARLPRFGSRTFYLQAYDAGSEFNDQLCINIPGPRCGGEAVSAPADNDEGFVHISNGFHDLGDVDEDGNEILGPFTYDWRNPVAKVVVRRVY